MTKNDDLTQTLHEAVDCHQAGDLSGAEKLYRRVLGEAPDHADALNLLGVVTQQKGSLEDALSLFDRAMAAAPGLATIPFNKANALRDADRNEDAIALYKTALDIDSHYTDARLNLGALLHECGHTQAAVAQFNALIKDTPDSAKGYYNLGKCRQTQGRLEDATQALGKAIDLDPGDPEVYFVQANVLADMGLFEEAISHIHKAIQLNPDWPESVSALGLILGRAGDYEKAFASCQTAINSDPGNILLYFNLSTLYYRKGDVTTSKLVLSNALKTCSASGNELLHLSIRALSSLSPWIAISLLESAIKQTRSAKILGYIGLSFDYLGLKSIALAYYNESIETDPSRATFFQARGKLKVSLESFETGWADLDQAADLENKSARNSNGLTTWAGEELKSKVILLTLDEGIGDQILFSTLIPDLIQNAELCIVECAKRLVPVLQRSYPKAKVTDWLDRRANYENRKTADYISPSVNAALYLRENISKFGSTTSLLKCNPDRVQDFRNKYEAIAQGRRIVGLSWLSGSPTNGTHKTLDLEALIQKFDPQSVLFVSLQYGPVNKLITDISTKTGVTIFEDETVDQLYDIDQFFAQVAAMDLVVSISNTAAHVSGSLGIPTWLLLPRGMGVWYYWFLDRTDSPWYPSVRIFRQKSILDEERAWWPEVIEDMFEALQAWIDKPLPPRLVP